MGGCAAPEATVALKEAALKGAGVVAVNALTGGAAATSATCRSSGAAPLPPPADASALAAGGSLLLRRKPSSFSRMSSAAVSVADSPVGISSVPSSDACSRASGMPSGWRTLRFS